MSHPHDEVLVGLAAGGLAIDEEEQALAHVAVCLDCRTTATAFARRVDSLAAPAAEVPPHLVEQVMRGWRSSGEAAAVAKPARQISWRRARALWFVPAALAAGAVLWLGSGIDERQSQGGELERGVEVEHSFYLRRERVELNAAPAANAAPVATLSRGARVTVLAKQGEWWKVDAGGGVGGWAERRRLMSDGGD